MDKIIATAKNRRLDMLYDEAEESAGSQEIARTEQKIAEADRLADEIGVFAETCLM